MKNFRSHAKANARKSGNPYAAFRAAPALGAAAMLLLGMHSAQAATSYTDSTGGTVNFSAAFSPAIPAGGTTTADTLIFNNAATSVQTDDFVAASRPLNANILTFSNTASLTLTQGAGTTITVGGAGATVNLNNTAALLYNLNLVFSASATIAGTGTGGATLSTLLLASTGNTLTFGTGSDAPLLTANGGVEMLGNLKIQSGTLSITNGSQFYDQGSDTYTQTGGNVNTNGFIEFANGGGTSTVNISGGNFTDTNANATDAFDMAVRGTTTLTLSGTGKITTPVLNMTTTQLSGGAAGSTFNLNGGTLTTNSIIKGTNGTTGTQTFNFNGGTLQASTAGSATFMTGLTTANVRNGGAVIDTQAFNDTIGQNLLHSSIGGDNAIDGGLTKKGTGTLTLTGANTYTGTTNINGGTLNVGSTGALGSTNAITFGGGTLQYSAANTTDYSNLIANSTGAISIDTNGQSVTFATGLAGTNTGGLTKLGTGTLTLTAANAYTGPTTITAGTLQLGNAGTTGSLPTSSAIADNGTLAFNRSNTAVQGTDFSGSAITSSGSVTQAGTGASVLTLNAANSYSGGTTLTNGALNINNATALGTGALSINGGGGTTPTFDNTSGAPITIANGISNNAAPGGGANLVFTGTNNLTTTGTLTFNNSDRSVIVNGSTLTVGSIANGTAGTNQLVKSGVGTLVITGAAGSDSGGVSVTAGTLVGTNPAAFGSGANAASQLNLTGATSTLSLLNNGAGNNGTIIYGGATVSNNGYNLTADTGTLNVGNNGSNTGNTIQLGTFTFGAGSNTVNITGSNGYGVNFAGGLTTGGANNITVNATAPVQYASLTGGAGKAVTFLGTGTQTVNGNLASTSPGTGYTLAVGVSTTGGTPGTVALKGTAAADLTSATIAGGSLSLYNAGSLGTAPVSLAAANGTNGTTATATLNLRNNANTTFNNAVTATSSTGSVINVDQATAGTGNTLTIGAVTNNGNILTFTNGDSYNLATGAVSSSASPTFTNNMTNGATTLASFADSATTAQTLTFNGTSATATTTIPGVISQGTGALSVKQSGTGTLLLNGVNTYTGTNTIASGLLGINSDSSLGAVPGSATADILFTGTGTLQDTTNNVTLNANRNVTLSNGVTATLDSAGNAFTVNGAITTTTGSATTTLTLNSTNTTTTSDLTGALSNAGTGGLVINKTGAGLWTLGSGSTPTSSTLTKGNITVNGGTLNFGSGTEAPSLTISGDANGTNVGVFVLNNSNLNVNAGTLAVTSVQGLVLSATNTYTQTGGAFSTNGLIEFANSGGNSTVNISGGSLTTTNAANGGVDATDLAVRGTTTLTLSGTGAFTTPTLNMSTSQLGSGAATSTFNLNGGTLKTGTVIKGTGGSTGTQTFNFNGGTLQASAASTTFMTGLTTANVRNNGAVIDTNSFNDTIGQALVHSTIGGDNATDGGLTKKGAGTLTLSGANTYNGGTTVSAGTLAAGVSTNAFGANTNLLTVNGGSVDLNGFGQQIGALVGTVGTTVTNSGGTAKNINDGYSNTNTTYAGNVTGNILFNKIGTGIQTLSGANTYTGGTSVNAGTLNITGSTSATGTVSVSSGATLTGTGTVGGAVADTGTINAGTVGTIGTINVGSLSFANASTLGVDLNATTSDLINSLGALSASATVNVAVNELATPGAASYTLATFAGGLAGAPLSDFTLSGITGYTLAESGNNLVLNMTPTTSPTTYTLAVTGGTNIHVGGTDVITNTITNNGMGTADTLNYTNLGDTVTSGSVTTTPNSGGPLAQGASSSQNQTFTGTTAGATTITASVGTATNATLGTNATLSGTVGTTTVNVYRLAAASAHTPEPVAFGNNHVSATVASQALTLMNTDPADGFSEKLDATIGSNTGGVTSGGAINLLAPQTSSSALTVGISTATSGSKNGTATITLTSDGSGTSGLGTTSIGTQTVNVTGNVYSGNETYQGSSGTYVTNNNATVQTQWNGGGAPGLDTNFKGQDTATINGLGNGGTGQTVTLDGATPNLAALTLGNGATLAQGTGGTLTLDGSNAGGTAALNGDGTATTLSAPVTVATATTATVATGGNLTVSGAVGGMGGLTVTGAGTVTLTGANNYIGNTVVGTAAGGVGNLVLKSAAADSTGTLTINSAGIVTVSSLGSTSGSGSALGGGGVTLNGGKLVNGNPSGATAATGATPSSNNYQNGGMLTLGMGTSYLDFGAGNTGAVFNFTGLQFTNGTSGTLLDILNYNGNFTDGTNGGDGTDQLFIGNTKSLSGDQLADIQFINPVGYTGTVTAAQLLDGEISPAPEPAEYATLSMIGLGLGGLILRARKRRINETNAAA